MGIMTSWGRLRRAAVVLFIGLAVAGCKKKDEDDGGKSDKSSDSLADEAAASDDSATEKSFTGKWKTAWGLVRLTQTGSTLKGTFNGQFTGTLSGTVDDRKASMKWVQTNGETGRCKFTLSGSGDTFKGTWGSGSSSTNGGPWNGTRAGSSVGSDTIGGGL